MRHPSLDESPDPGIRIVVHDPSWALQAEGELRRLAGVLGSLAVRLEHVGSTAVPRQAAKPILDLQISVASLEPRHVCQAESRHEPRHVAVRDYLREHAAEAAAHAALKTELAARHPTDRLAYMAGTAQYVDELEARALEWARRRG